VKQVTAIVTGRRTAWIVLLGCLLALGVALAFVPRPSSVAQLSPATAGDSARAAQWLAHVPSADTTNGIVVWTRTDSQPLTPAQRAAVSSSASAVAALSPQPKVAWTQLSPDRTTILVVVPIATAKALKDAPAVADSLMQTARAGLPAGVRAELTGPLASLADSARASGGSADQTLGVWLIVLAAVLLILGTRSIVLWVVPLVLAGAVATLAYLVGADVSTAIGLPFGGWDSALVFAVTLALATAYSLVYILALRAELSRSADSYQAAARSLAARAPGIALSALILLVGALVFLFAADSRVRALGLSIGIGIVLATLTVLLAVAAGLALLGRRSLWLALSSPDDSGAERVGPADRRTILVSFVTAVILGAVMTGVAALVVPIAPPTDTHAEQARASIDRAFTPGYENESVMIVPNSLKRENSVIAPTALAMNLPHSHSVTVGDSYQGFAVLTTDFDVDPGSTKALDTIRKLRGLIATTGGPTAMTFIGGPDATAVDQLSAASTDLEMVVPIALVLVLLLLFLADLRERRLRE
jgi:putative drug exporter of the RND superfamily